MATWDTLAPQVIQRLSSDLSLSPEQAAGIVGHLGYESDGLQAINERKPVVPGSRGGFGWAQWTGPRRQQFEAWAQKNKADVTDPETNYQFLLHELTATPEGRVLDAIRAAPDAQTAGRIFTDQFLRPGIPAHDKRATWTERALSLVLPTAQAGTLPENQKMSMAERIQKARDAGFNDEEILQRIQGNADMAQRIQKARDAGFTDEEIFGRMGLQIGGQGQTQPQAPEQPEPSFAQRAGNTISELGRQVGLTGRYALEGVGQSLGMLSEPIRQGLNVGLRAAGLPEAAPAAAVASMGADALGLPAPQNASERVVGDIARTMASAGTIAGGAGALSQGATGVTQAALNTLAANPAHQVASAAGAGGAGGAVREAGGGPLAQAGAALAGGIAAPMALSGAQSVARSVQGRLTSMRPDQVDDAIQRALQQSGVDWRQVPERVRQQLRQEAGQALRTGNDLDPAAMARLADFRRIEGATPTRGMLTQDPGQITREMNLAKQQANTANLGGSRNLSQVQADNNAALVRALDSMGADSADDTYAAGQRAIDALQARLGSRQAQIKDLYSLAKDSQGRSFPLDSAAFTQRAGQLLDDNLAGGALPADVRNHLNRIAQGEVPFTVDYAEQLRKVMNRLHRNTSDGSTRYALGLVRQALDDTPVMPLGRQPTPSPMARAVNPGQLPATQGAEVGEQAVAAFNQARSANRSMMRQIERTPALKDLYEGKIAPDNFVNKYVISPSAKVTDVQRLGRMLAADPTARDSVRGSITQYLKSRALSGQPDDVGIAKFSPSQYAKALQQLGDRKLSAFFDPQEIEQLHAISRAGRLMVNQPAGSAVNNSNTAATAIGRTLDMMGSAGRSVRLLGIGDQIGAIQSGLRQRSAQQVSPALSLPSPSSGNYLIPASLYGSLLAAPGLPRPEDNHRP